MDLFELNLSTFFVFLGGIITFLGYMRKRDKELIEQASEFDAIKKDIENIKQQSDKNEKRLEKKIDDISLKIDEMHDKIFHLLKK
jgi:uncharacterized protein YoxC